MGNFFCKGDKRKTEVEHSASTSEQKCTVPESQRRGQPQSQRINDYDRCMLQLKTQRDKLNAATRMYEERASIEREAAKQLLAEGKREKARYCLKRRKAQEVHLTRVHQYLDNIMTMIQSVEDRQLGNEVATALKQGAEELKALNEHLSLEDIEQIMSNASDQIEITNEASALLSQNLVSLDQDDDELLAELEALSSGATEGAPTLKTASKTSATKRQQDQLTSQAASASNTTEGTTITVVSGLVVPTTSLTRAEAVTKGEEDTVDQEVDEETGGLLSA